MTGQAGQSYVTRNINKGTEGPTNKPNNGQGIAKKLLNTALSEGPEILENKEMMNRTMEMIMQRLTAIHDKNPAYASSKHYIAIQNLLTQQPVNHSIILLSIFLLSQEMNTHNLKASIYKGAIKVYIPDGVAKGLADGIGIISTLPMMTITGLAHSSIALQRITQPFVESHKKTIIKTLTLLLSRYTKTPMQKAMMQAVVKKIIEDMALPVAKSVTIADTETNIYTETNINTNAA